MIDTLRTDFLVLGSGIAGLRAAVGLARHGAVLVVTKDQPSESNTGYAQGGVAVAMGADDDTRLHLEDTVRAGVGIVSGAAARVLVEEGPERVRELAAWGACSRRRRTLPWPPATEWPWRCERGRPSSTWSSSSSIRRRSRFRARRGSSSPRRCAAKGRTCAMPRASGSPMSWRPATRWP